MKETDGIRPTHPDNVPPLSRVYSEEVVLGLKGTYYIDKIPAYMLKAAGERPHRVVGLLGD